MNLHDVVSLFTHILINEALKVETLAEQIRPAPDNIMDLLQFVLCTTYFMFGGKICQQIQGASVGSTVSVVICTLYMEDHEESQPHQI